MRLTLSLTSCTILPHMLGMRIARCIERQFQIIKATLSGTKARTEVTKRSCSNKATSWLNFQVTALKCAWHCPSQIAPFCLICWDCLLPSAPKQQLKYRSNSLWKKARTEVTKKVLLQQSHKLAQLPSNSFNMRLTSSQINCSVLHRMPGLPISSCIEATCEVTMQPLLVTKQRLKWLNI